MYGDDDIPAMLAKSPHTITDPAVVAGKSAKCWLDERDEFALEGPTGGGGQIVHITVATIQTSAFPELKAEDAVQITSELAGPQDFIIWRRQQLDDGLVTQLLLRRQ